MARITINGTVVDVPDGTTILDAARGAGITNIPTLCHVDGIRPLTSCMVCVVKDVKTGRLTPSCSARANDGMEIETDCDEVRAARREILNLLLSEHVGDCEAPCRRICPASLNIPLMTRQIAAGKIGQAARTAKLGLVIPSVLGRICPAPCEKGCRRSDLDRAIPIRSLHRFAGDCETESSIMPAPETGRTVAVVGGGPAGLAAAWTLRLRGHTCSLFERESVAGGSLRAVSGDELPASVIDREITSIQKLGVTIETGREIRPETFSDDLIRRFDAVIIACSLDVPKSDTVFLAPEHKMVVRAVGNGKKSAASVDRFLAGSDVLNVDKPFDSKIGKLRSSEIEQFRENCNDSTEVNESTETERVEAARCLHCDCRKLVSCSLREYAAEYDARQTEYRGDERQHVEIVGRPGDVVYEPGKCIRCGLCVEITAKAREPLGLTFVGRGFNVRVRVPFGESVQAGLRTTAADCVNACPTGALVFRRQEEREE